MYGGEEFLLAYYLAFLLTSSFLDPKSLRTYCGIYGKNFLAGSCEEDREPKL